MRSDAARNRARLLDAAREIFATRGPDVALEEIAAAAEVSRTTLYRNFPTRQELAVTIFEDNVAAIEAHARELRSSPRAVIELFDRVLDMQRENRGTARILAGRDQWLDQLGERTVAAFAPLVRRGKRAGLLQSGVDAHEILIAFSMAGRVERSSKPDEQDEIDQRIRKLLHRALFKGQSVERRARREVVRREGIEPPTR